MARGKRKAQQLEGADEFIGADPEKEAIEKIAAARAAAEKEKPAGDNGGPMLDEAAWQRAVNEYTAEMLTMEDLATQKAEVAGRISSIRKVAKKLKVDWDLVKRYYEEHKAIRKGAMGAMVTEERRYRWLLKVMGSPLGTQFTLWELEPEEAGAGAQPGMDAELQGQHAFSNREDRENNPFQQGTEDYVAWDAGWNNAMAAAARKMGPNGEAAH
jgi:hypothetical protein